MNDITKTKKMEGRVVPKCDKVVCGSKKYCGGVNSSCAVGCAGLTVDNGFPVFNEKICKDCGHNYACVKGCTVGAIKM